MYGFCQFYTKIRADIDQMNNKKKKNQIHIPFFNPDEIYMETPTKQVFSKEK